MDWQRTLLISGMAITAWLLLIQWNDFIDQRDKIVDDSNENPTEQIDYFSDSNVIELEEEVEEADKFDKELGEEEKDTHFYEWNEDGQSWDKKEIE